MSEAFSAGANYVASAIAQRGTATYVAAYVATYAIEIYALTRISKSLEKSPPMTIFPSGCNARAWTMLLGPVPTLKVAVASSEPSGLILAIRGRDCELIVVN